MKQPMMNYSRAAGWLALFLLSTLAASAGCKTSRPAAPQDTLQNALLWKIEGHGLGEASYLFGTIHIIPKEDFFLPSGFEEAFKKSHQVVFEIDLDEMTDMSAMMGVFSNIMMNDGVTLDALLSKAEYKEVADYFESMGLPMFLLNGVKPMFLSMMAETNMDPSQMDEDNILSYEMEIYDKAKAAEKKVGGLETMEFQLSLFDSIPYSDQARMLLDAVRSTNTDDGSFDEMIRLYKAQNIGAMVEMVADDETSGLGDYADLLLKNRNSNWIPVMSKKMKKGSCLFAVGAGHLGGPDGVISLLRKEGYTLTPVSVDRGRSSKKI